MKKLLALLLLIGLAGAFPIPAVALPVRLAGNDFNPINWGRYPHQGSGLQLTTAIGDRIHGAAVIDGIQNLAGDGNLSDSLNRLSLREAYLEVAPGATGRTRLRLGTLDIEYSPYLASFQPWQGLGLSGWEPGGGVRANAFYSWSENVPVWGSRLDFAPAPGVDLSLNLIGDETDLNRSIEGVAQPFDPLVVSWAMARNRQGAGPVKLDAVYNVNERITLRSGFRSFPTLEEFDPGYRDTRTDDFGDPANPVDLYHGQTGFSGGVTVKLAGFNTGFDLERYQQRVGAGDDPGTLRPGANQRYRISLTRSHGLGWGTFLGGYARSYHRADGWEEVGNDWKGGLRFNSPLLRGLEVGAEFRAAQRVGVPEPVYRAVGVIGYARSGLHSKWVYNFYTGETAAETYVQVRF
ncbi:hypothetical protein EDC14_1003146 [Hydrogenispora ethanolica]|uniref:Capsule assembly protein Wzi n=1 Tax=Hydrogenispora ethanolica TaxID=1082276 RepID=A0A4R1S7Y7_HYDET|nr:hypothetical protein [Hydrogenispora ethanolica]TCL75214.1 hypothetical protein EDC14_1003146 [Hydrogenispora ethanolica]